MTRRKIAGEGEEAAEPEKLENVGVDLGRRAIRRDSTQKSPGSSPADDEDVPHHVPD